MNLHELRERVYLLTKKGIPDPALGQARLALWQAEQEAEVRMSLAATLLGYHRRGEQVYLTLVARLLREGEALTATWGWEGLEFVKPEAVAADTLLLTLHNGRPWLALAHEVALHREEP